MQRSGAGRSGGDHGVDAVKRFGGSGGRDMCNEVKENSFDRLAELFAQDVDRALLARSKAMTPTERIRWLEEMQTFAEEAKKARSHEARRAARDPDQG